MNIEFQEIRADTCAVIARGVWAGRMYYSSFSESWMMSWASNVSEFSLEEIAEIKQAARRMRVVLNITTRLTS